MRPKRLIIFLCVVAAVIFSLEKVSAFTVKNYRVLCLYKSSEGTSYNNNECLNMLGLPLHYLGMRVKYHDIDSGLLGDSELKKYDAVISWFGTPEMKDAAGYCEFVKRAVQLGLKYIVFENFGAYVDSNGNKPVPMEAVNGAFEAVGYRYLGEWTAETRCVAIEYKDRAMCEFETPYAPGTSLFYTKFRVLNPSSSEVFLRVKRTDLADSSSDAAFVTANGAMILNGYAYYGSSDFKIKKWRIDPFAFLTRALGLEATLRLDFTTKNGRRIALSHIDGDGFSNISENDRKSLSSEVMRDCIFAHYKNLKFSVSFITGEIDPAYSKDGRKVTIAKSIAALPNVEIASHGFSHPHDWEKKAVNLKIPGYEFDYSKEIKGSIDFLNSAVAPAGKKSNLIFWSGRCNPNAAAMKCAASCGALNINGGDSKCDSKYSSLLFLRPPYLNVGGGIQILTAAPNEVIYTDLFRSNFGGYKNVVETFENTEKPRRLSAVDAYFHFFSAQKKESLDAVRHVLDYIVKSGFEPVFTSEYVEMVNDFNGAEISKISEGVYGVKTSGRLPCVRFDSSKIAADMEKCKNVTGSWYINNSLYIGLDGSVDHVVAIKKKKAVLPK